MNNVLINITNQVPALTMSSVEIAELTGKQHKNVMADIRIILDELGLDVADFSAPQPYGNNNTREVFNLSKRLTLILTSGYSIKLRMKIIDRLEELEATQPKLPNFSDPIAAAQAFITAETARREAQVAQQAALVQLEAVQQLNAKAEEKLREAAPKVKLVDNTFSNNDLIPVLDFARTLDGVNLKQIQPYLAQRMGWLTAKNGKYQADRSHTSNVVDKLNPDTGKMGACLTPIGRLLLNARYESASLPMKADYAASWYVFHKHQH